MNDYCCAQQTGMRLYHHLLLLSPPKPACRFTPGHVGKLGEQHPT
jgi:hypothetical protein